MGVFFGEKTIAWFDVWSIEHLVAGISAYSIAAWIGHHIHKGEAVSPALFKRIIFLILLVMAYGWETLEHYLEAGTTGLESVTYWFQGVEFWGNRLITDPLLVLVGGYLAMKHPRLITPARIFSATWLIIHIFVFPHSMYLHTLLE